MKNNDKNVLNFNVNTILNDLNNEQKKAVIFYGKPQIVLSGAGSGKTRVLTYKNYLFIKN